MPVSEKIIHQFAARVIRNTDRDNPADAVLREMLRHEREMEPAQRREISRCVFTYHRWYGLLNQQKDLFSRLKQAEELDQSYSRKAGSFTAADLRRVVPEWVFDEAPANADWLRAIQTRPRLWLRARRGRGSALVKQLGRGCERPLPGLPDALTYAGDEDLFQRPEFQRGEFEIQDIASQLVGHLCAPKPGQTWWDACAGEGGKMLHLADLMENKGLIWASDRSERRLGVLKKRAGRAGVFNYRMKPWNAKQKLPTRTRFDGVLVDAPCSCIGTWGRNPQARWTTRVEDVIELAEVQTRMLEVVAGSVKPGGRLVYAVCTLARRETTEVARAFQASHPEFTPVALQLPGAEAAVETPIIWPQKWHGNGMFVAAWQRADSVSKA